MTSPAQLDFTFQQNLVYYDNPPNDANTTSTPQWLANGSIAESYWNCTPTITGTPPCPSLFAFKSNDYWSPNNGIPTFVTVGPAQWQFGTASLHWQSTNSGDPDEDQNVTGQGISVYAYPGFNNPIFPADDYTFESGFPPVNVGFNVTQFTNIPGTFTAGRNNPIIFAPPVSPGFPLALVGPSKF